jgi:hypothetical protein
MPLDLPIRTLAEGEKISEPGLYQIPLEVHHGQPCVGKSVTSSVIRRAELYSLADVWAFSPWNPHRFPDKDSDAKSEGRGMAYLVEGGIDLLMEHFRVLPEDAPRRPTKPQIEAFEKKGVWSDAAKEGAEFWEKWDSDPRETLDSDQWTKLVFMGEVLSRNDAASAALGGLPEVSIAWQDAKTGLWILSRPDNVNFDGTVADYKKMSSQGKPFTHHLVDRRITEHGYDMQMALAAEGMEQVGLGWPSSAFIVAQLDSPPYHVIARPIEEDILRLAQWRNRRSLDAIARCLETGYWPGPGDDVGAYQMPDKLRERLEAEKNATTAPNDDDPTP